MNSQGNVKTISVKPLHEESCPQFVLTVTDCSLPSGDMVCRSENDIRKQVGMDNFFLIFHSL